MEFNRDLSVDNKEYYKYVLEANSFERLELYKQHGAASVDNTSRLVHVGNIGGMEQYPVWIQVSIDHYENYKYISIEATGVYADWNLIKRWITFHFTDAKLIDCSNFNQIINSSRGI